MVQNLTLVIGDKNLSSWSMRPWLVLKASGLPFAEKKITLDTSSTRKTISRFSPSGRVPVLIHDKLKIWDSLAICEYIAELAPNRKLWPAHAAHRALARSLVTEMHSGFQSLRSQLPMDIQLRMKIKHLSAQTVSDIERIVHIWSQSMKTNGGPFLFGDFNIVDAFYAPVVMRFLSYQIQIKDKRVLQYIKNMSKQKYIETWIQDAQKEKTAKLVF